MKRGYNQHTKGGDSLGPPPRSQKEASAKFGVPIHSIRRAKAVEEKGVPELKEAVKNETVSLSDAAGIVNEPPAVQKQAVEAVLNGKATTLKGAIEGTNGHATNGHAKNGHAKAHKAATEAANGTPVENPAEICGVLDQLIERTARVPTGNAKDAATARDLACEGLKTARTLLRRLAAVLGTENARTS